jgi:hypothetical protein
MLFIMMIAFLVWILANFWKDDGSSLETIVVWVVGDECWE